MKPDTASVGLPYFERSALERKPVHRDIDKWDVGTTKRLVALTRPMFKLYFRSEVRGPDRPGASAVSVDAYVRRVMQRGLDALAAKRRFPILG